MSLDDTTFARTADDTLETFMDVIEEALGDQADVDLEGGILTIELDVGGEYVINKHAPNKQIWMSSPLSGPLRYDYDPAAGVWFYARDGHGLRAKLSEEVESLLGLSVEF